ncbi:MAG TPA: spermidine/putrescine ABC transporter substrate-binding protein, partial [Acidimicrobiia bacterium]|nr:spermidine/putrescine ABC transporter substrate-binding protein [Acidimicrobiia bacterium]
MHRYRRLFAVLAALVLVVAACGDDDEEPSGGGDGGGDSSGPIEEIGEGEGEVVIIAWPGYIERGETDPAYDWVTEFEE